MAELEMPDCDCHTIIINTLRFEFHVMKFICHLQNRTLTAEYTSYYIYSSEYTF